MNWGTGCSFPVAVVPPRSVVTHSKKVSGILPATCYMFTGWLIRQDREAGRSVSIECLEFAVRFHCRVFRHKDSFSMSVLMGYTKTFTISRMHSVRL